MIVQELYSVEYLQLKQSLLQEYISKDLLIDLQQHMIATFELSNSYRIGDYSMRAIESSSGVFDIMKELSITYHFESLIEFLNTLSWYEYDDVMATIFYEYGRKYGLYHKKRRYRNIVKAISLQQ